MRVSGETITKILLVMLHIYFSLFLYTGTLPSVFSLLMLQRLLARFSFIATLVFPAHRLWLLLTLCQQRAFLWAPFWMNWEVNDLPSGPMMDSWNAWRNMKEDWKIKNDGLIRKSFPKKQPQNQNTQSIDRVTEKYNVDRMFTNEGENKWCCS